MQCARDKIATTYSVYVSYGILYTVYIYYIILCVLMYCTTCYRYSIPSIDTYTLCMIVYIYTLCLGYTYILSV